VTQQALLKERKEVAGESEWSR